jgi:tol-pal system protein YbgF
MAAGPLVVLAAAVLLVSLLAETAAEAQTAVQLNSQIRMLRNEIISLRKQLTDLERVVHTDAAPRSATPEAPPDDGTSERISRRLAELETAIDETREWRRNVTGSFEEFENQLNRIEGRIERLVADVDFRLSALERRPGAAPAAAVDSPAVATTAAATAAGVTTATEPASLGEAGITPGLEEGYDPSGAPRPLGTVPAEQAPDDTLPLGLTPGEQYEAAYAILLETRYEEAHDALSRFIDANPTHGLAQNAAYWRAESLYARKMYPEAAKSYALNLRQYPEGRKAPDNMVKLGMALLKLGRGEEACRTFAQLDQAFSDPPLRIRRAAQQGRQQASCP